MQIPIFFLIFIGKMYCGENCYYKSDTLVIVAFYDYNYINVF